MDRTPEFNGMIPGTEKIEHRQPKFYEEIYCGVQEIAFKASKAASYKTLLLLDNELNAVMKKCTELFQSVSLDGPDDLKQHFEGVKFIVNRGILNASKRLAVEKKKAMSIEVELEPQKPESFKKIADNEIYEQETRRIVESTQYEATRQRLLKIEEVQKAIQENLLLQDERIDGICISHVETTKIYGEIKGSDFLYKGSFFRRAAFTIILCLSFVLLFVHFYHRK